MQNQQEIYLFSVNIYVNWRKRMFVVNRKNVCGKFTRNKKGGLCGLFSNNQQTYAGLMIIIIVIITHFHFKINKKQKKREESRVSNSFIFAWTLQNKNICHKVVFLYFHYSAHDSLENGQRKILKSEIEIKNKLKIKQYSKQPKKNIIIIINWRRWRGVEVPTQWILCGWLVG